jgi:hypothetical protein
MNYFIDFSRLSYLGDKLKSGTATKQEKDEYMLMLYNNGSISKNQYNDYLANGNKNNSDEIVNAALSIGAVLLIGYIISEMFKGK